MSSHCSSAPQQLSMHSSPASGSSKHPTASTISQNFSECHGEGPALALATFCCFRLRISADTVECRYTLSRKVQTIIVLQQKQSVPCCSVLLHTDTMFAAFRRSAPARPRQAELSPATHYDLNCMVVICKSEHTRVLSTDPSSTQLLWVSSPSIPLNRDCCCQQCGHGAPGKKSLGNGSDLREETLSVLDNRNNPDEVAVWTVVENDFGRALAHAEMCLEGKP